jgi:hypothetical protein
MIDATVLVIATIGTGSLALSFAEYALSRRKRETCSATEPLKRK